MKASAESKETDDRSLESGLSYIGLVLENAERQIANIWSMYEGSNQPALVKYPTKYSLRSEEERNEEVKNLFDKMEKIPSVTYQKAVAKKAAQLLLEQTVRREDLNKIHEEIDNSPNLTSDPDIIRADVETGLVSKELASKLRGYPSGEVEKAKKEHADRLALIAKSQSEASAARGVPDADGNPNSGKEEKKESRDRDDKNDDKDPVRGEGKSTDVAQRSSDE
jgi:hypothetical protein